MNLTPILPLAAAAFGVVGTITIQWLNAQVSRRQKRADVQEQTIKDLQDTLATFRPPKATVYKDGDDSGKSREEQLKAIGNKLDQIGKSIDRTVKYRTTKRRVEVLNSRVRDLEARRIVVELVALADEITKETDTKAYYGRLNLLDEKFSLANDRLGEVLRSLH